MQKMPLWVVLVFSLADSSVRAEMIIIYWIPHFSMTRKQCLSFPLSVTSEATRWIWSISASAIHRSGAHDLTCAYKHSPHCLKLIKIWVYSNGKKSISKQEAWTWQSSGRRDRKMANWPFKPLIRTRKSCTGPARCRSLINQAQMPSWICMWTQVLWRGDHSVRAVLMASVVDVFLSVNDHGICSGEPLEVWMCSSTDWLIINMDVTIHYSPDSIQFTI